MSLTYRTAIRAAGNNTGIPVPDDVVERLGAGRRPRVVADIDGYILTTTLGSMGGEAMISFSKAHREASGFAAGREVTVSLSVADAPAELAIPDDLADALTASPAAKAFFDQLAPSFQKNFVTQITNAKQASTRERRVVGTIQKLESGQKR